MRFSYQAEDQPLEGYTIRKPLGHGGFGEVYYAVSDAGKEVALKLVQRFLDVELRGVSQCLNLKHPNLVTIYDLRTTPAEEHWVVMEYVEGPTLAEVLARNPRGLAEEEAIGWLEGMAAGVGYLHEKGLVHRDLKPGNLFIEEGTVKVGDYGLSKFITVSRRSGQTQSVGTVHYMAPEIGSGRYGPEVDIYSLGVMFYEMLSGDVPFDGETPTEILMKHLTAEPDLSRVPAAFQGVVGRMLAKNPEERYPTIREMLEDVRGGATNPALAATVMEGPGSKVQGPGLVGEGGAAAEAGRREARPPSVRAAHGAAAASFGAVARPQDVGTLSWLMPRSSVRRRWGESLREHPILWPLAVLLTLLVLTVPVTVMVDYLLPSDQLPGYIVPYWGRALIIWLLCSVGLSLALCAWSFLWRVISPTAGMLARQHLPHARHRRRWGESLREHPVLWSLCVFLTLFPVGAGLTVPVLLLAPSRSDLSEGAESFLGDGGLLAVNAAVAVLLCAWAFLWRAVSPTERILAGRADGEATSGFGARIGEFFSGLRDLRRSNSDSEIAGVCGGLGEHTPVPSWVWRALFLGLFFFGGSGVMVYLILWFCIPEAETAESEEDSLEITSVSGQEEGVFAGRAARPQTGVVSVRGPGIALIVVGILGLIGLFAVVAFMLLFLRV